MTNPNAILVSKDGKLLAMNKPDERFYILDDDGKERYYAALQSSISAAEEEQVEFKDQEQVWDLLDGVTDAEERPKLKGRSFPVPSGWEIRVRYYELCDVWCGGAGCVPFKPNKEKCSGHPFKKLEKPVALLVRVDASLGVVKTPFCLTVESPKEEPKEEKNEFPISFIEWYSGMTDVKIRHAYERYLKEVDHQ